LPTKRLSTVAGSLIAGHFAMPVMVKCPLDDQIYQMMKEA